MGFFCFALLFGLLKAVHIGDFVRIEGYHDNRLNGKVGVVKVVDHRVLVKVFLHDQFISGLATESLTNYFNFYAFDDSKLVIIKPRDWKPRKLELLHPYFKATGEPISVLEQLGFDSNLGHLAQSEIVELKNVAKSFNRLTEFTVDIYTIDGITEDIKILSVWMNQTCQVSFINSLPQLYPLVPGSLLILTRLDGRYEKYNRQLAVIIRKQGDLILVLVIHENFLKFDHEEAFTCFGVSERNIVPLTQYDWFDNRLLSMEVVRRILRSDDIRVQLKRCRLYINEMCNNDSRALLEDDTKCLKARLIGAWVNLQFGKLGMAAVKGEEDEISSVLTHLWNGISAKHRR